MTHTRTFTVVSHHSFRRTARWKLKRLKRLQENARLGEPRAQAKLAEERIDRDTHLDVREAERGPDNWYVVAYR